MAISINFTKTVDNAVDLSQKKTYINGAFTSAEDIANFPTAGIAVGSELVNVGGGNDTGKKYVFSGTEWNLAPSGGGGSSNKFIVTLTPTAQDYSGTMDKTVAEIYEAYQSGMKIVFRVMQTETNYMDVDCTARWFGGVTYPSFNGFILMEGDVPMLVFAATGSTNDGTKATYGTELYSLTPVS